MDQNQFQFAGSNSSPLKPFLKWAGGKSRLLSHYKALFPEKFNNYFEPFCGSAAVFFYLKTAQSRGTFTFKNAMLSDINQELILTYQIVRDNVVELIELLYLHRLHHDKEYYYRIRSLNVLTLSDLERAARFIYLNKTCFNGLYRVNSNGQFNVPIGNYKHPQIFNELELKFASESLKEVTIQVDNFCKVLTHASKDDFIYLDPPYFQSTKSRLYGSNGDLHVSFDHERFAWNVRRCPHRWLITYDDSPEIRRLFSFANIYSWELQYGMNNYKQEKAAKGRELFIANYELNSGC